MIGIVYFIQCKDRVKIGRAVNLPTRIGTDHAQAGPFAWATGLHGLTA